MNFLLLAQDAATNAIHVDETLSNLSDYAFRTSFGLYAAALLFFLVFYASYRVPKHEVAGATADGDEATAQQGGNGSTVLTRSKSITDTGDEDRTSTAGTRWWRIAIMLTGAAFVFHAVSLVLRGVATSRMPLGNMYEFISFTCALTVAVAFVALRKPAFRTAWPFVLAPILILLFFGGTHLYTDAAPVVPALQSYWLPIHVTIVSLGAALFLPSGVASILYLLRTWMPVGEEKGSFAGLVRPLPTGDVLDRVAYRTAIIGFPIFTVGIILGAVWAEGAWGRFWGWDPKETVSFISWVIYAVYLHARATTGWGPSRAAWINIIGFATTVFNLFFINLVTSGLHSYAGV